MVALILFFFIAISISFSCSIWEAVLLSITPSFASRIGKEKPAIGKLLSKYKDDIDRPLSAILTLNTIAHTTGAMGVGVQAGKIFGATELNLYFFNISYESLIAGLMTLAILILSEIIPKTIGANYWKQLTPFTVRCLRVLMFILKPFVWLSMLITNRIKKEGEKSVFSRADMAAMADAGLLSGAIDKEEKSIIQNLLKLENILIKEIMTPRTVINIVDENQTMGELYEKNNPFQFSRIPVYTEKPNNVSGFILKDNILENIAADNFTKKVTEIKRKVLFTEPEATVASVFDMLISKKEHMAMVADEYGTMVGLVTIEDIVETLFGFEIVDESDKVADLQKLAREKWEKAKMK
jgi:CBS domain containing-hemolysin-like protein